MKRTVSLLLAVLMTATLLVGCGQEKNRILYNDEKLSKFVELGEYKNIPVDTKSDTLKGFFEDVIESDVSTNDLYVKKTEGTVAEGDTANIDYTGKKEGVAFEGGTAEGYDLKIGSNSFIDGFEDGLIGVAIGDTVDLNLTFPADYDSAELAGKAVVFTVKVNYVKTEEKRNPEEYYSELGFETYEKYNEDVEIRGIKNYLLDTVTANSKIKDYPKDDKELLSSFYNKSVESNIKSQYGIDLKTYLSYVGQTEEQFKEEILENQVKPMMDTQLLIYAILDKEDIKVEPKEVDKKVAEIIKEIGNMSVDADTLKAYYGDFYFEALVASEKAVDFIYDNAKIS